MPFLGQVALDIPRHLRVQHAGEDLRGCFHHSDGHAPVKEVLRQLQADEAAADDPRPSSRRLVQIVPHGEASPLGAHGEHAV